MKRALLVLAFALGVSRTALADDVCSRFRASQAASPKVSTLLDLADCYERNGQTASAWSSYTEAEALARKTNFPDWENTAKTHANALFPKLVRLTITVPEEAKVPNLVVTRDGAKLAPGEWGVAVPVDPGEHVVGASADGYISIEKHIPISSDTGDGTYVLPTLEKLPPPRAEPDTAPAEPPKGFPRAQKPVAETHWSGLEVAGVATGGAGILALAAGGIMSLVAAGNYDNAKAHCSNGTHGCDAGAVRAANDAYDVAAMATVTIISGAVLLAAGAALVLFSPSDKKLAHAEHVLTW